MASFAKDSERLLELVGTGLSMAEACQGASIPYGTAKKWVDAGRKAPDGPYGAWLARLTAAKAGAPDDDDASPRRAGDPGPGPVELRVDALLRGCEPSQQAALAGAQAKALARRIDQLSTSPGAAAATAMAHCSRRLEELTPQLEAPREERPRSAEGEASGRGVQACSRRGPESAGARMPRLRSALMLWMLPTAPASEAASGDGIGREPRIGENMTDKQRLDRIERAIAQLASGLRITGGWKPRANNQTALAEILEEAQTAVEREREEVPA